MGLRQCMEGEEHAMCVCVCVCVCGGGGGGGGGGILDMTLGDRNLICGIF